MNKAEKKKALLEAAAQAVNVKQYLMERNLGSIIDMASGIARIIKSGGKVYLAGNGGSAADCQHFATEMIVRLTGKGKYKNRPALPAISLTADTSLLTAAGNDFKTFDRVFSRQVEGLISRRDLLLLISTSGNSENLIMAARAAKKKKAPVYALLGSRGGAVKRYAERTVIVPSDSVPRIQEEHIFIIHNLVYLVERELY
jgi:D-sedoheptulose 7-phosphate isomerase